MSIFIPYQGTRGGFTPRNIPEINEGSVAEFVGQYVEIGTPEVVLEGKIVHTDFNWTIIEFPSKKAGLLKTRDITSILPPKKSIIKP